MTGVAEERDAHLAEDPETPARARLAEFFEAEGREYCERLIARFASEAELPRGELVAAVSDARVIRGSAAMAGFESISTMARHLERIFKALHERRLAWTPELAATLQRGARELLALVDDVRRWDVAHDARAGDWAAELEPYDVPRKSLDQQFIVPIARLFHSDAGPHILYVPVTPQTQFEQRLRMLARRGPHTIPPPTPRISAVLRRRSSSALRGQELRALLRHSVTRLNASFGDVPNEPMPIERLLYSGPAALQRAREVAHAIRSLGPERSRELLPELLDLLDLASRG